jgi:hypothetical protein
VESFLHLVTVCGGGHLTPSWTEVLGNGTIRGQEALGVPGGLEPLHPPFPLARGLMGVLSAVI